MKKIILSSFLMIALCLMIISGATYALFTSEAKTDISITSGKVDVTSSIVDLKLYSMDQEQEDNFENGGTAVEGDGSISINLMTPGDKVTFDIVIINNSNINVMARTVIGVNTASDYELFNALDVKVGSDTSLNEYLVVSVWEELTEEETVVSVSIELPLDAGNEYQDSSCELFVALEAVQANGIDLYESTLISEVSNQTELFAALELETNVIKLTDDITVVGGETLVVPNNTIIIGGNHTLDLTGKATFFGFGLFTNSADSSLILAGQNVVLSNLTIILGSNPVIVGTSASVEMKDVNISGQMNAAIGIFNLGTLAASDLDISFANQFVPDDFRIVSVQDSVTAVTGSNVDTITTVADTVEPFVLAQSASVLFETLNAINDSIESEDAQQLASATYELNQISELLASLEELDDAVFAKVDGLVGNLTADMNETILEIIDEKVAEITGTGTQEDPFLVTTATELNMMRLKPDAHYKLTTDIDLDGFDWLPIGSIRIDIISTHAWSVITLFSFSGSLDGNDHQIKNLVAPSNFDGNFALFQATDGAVIKNLTLDCNITVLNKGNAALIVNANDSTISNVKIYGQVTGTSIASVALYAKNGTIIEDTVNYADLISSSLNSVEYAFIGGIVVQAGDTATNTKQVVLKNVANYGNLTAVFKVMHENGKGFYTIASPIVAQLSGNNVTFEGEIICDGTIIGNAFDVNFGGRFIGYAYDEDGNYNLDGEPSNQCSNTTQTRVSILFGFTNSRPFSIGNETTVLFGEVLYSATSIDNNRVLVLTEIQ